MKFIDFAQVVSDDRASAGASGFAVRARDYVIWDDGLNPAINAALLLGKPLLLTGEPGTGKTTLADRIAWKLGLEEPLTFLTKSNSVASDLFYSYDALGRLQSAYSRREDAGSSPAAADFLSFNALGKAILASSEANAVPETVRRFRGVEAPRRAVVVVDEVDKANRDFPNDLLFEFDRLEFRIPELPDTVVKADRRKEIEPILIVTSNSEKSLPDAFLRRCVYHHLTFPEDREVLRRIVVPQVERRVGQRLTTDSAFLNDCFEFFAKVRGARLLKPPATGELVDWMTLLAHFEADTSKSLRESPVAFRRSLHALAKFKEDLQAVQEEMKRTLSRAA